MADALAAVVERFLALSRARNPDPSPEMAAAWEAFGRGESALSLVPCGLDAWAHRVVTCVEHGLLVFVHDTGGMVGASLIFTGANSALDLVPDTPPDVAAFLRRIRDELTAEEAHHG